MEMANGFFRGDSARPSWSESWSIQGVDDARWEALKSGLKSAATELLGHIGSKQNWQETLSVTGALSSFGHCAYHLGAIRQLRKLALDKASRAETTGIGVFRARQYEADGH